MAAAGASAAGRRPTPPLAVGLMIPNVEEMVAGATARWSDIAELARVAEDSGIDTLWVVDHLLFPPQGPRTTPLGAWECFSLLAALAATTRRIALGTFVACTTFRNPALLAKMADTIEEISGGRLILGLGAGNVEAEHRAFGHPFAYRTSRFAEALAIVHALLRTGHADFAGEYYQVRECELRPRGPRPSGPPLMLGTTGERGMRLAARYADTWNVPWGRTGNTAAGAAEYRAAVDAACVAEGRDPATLARSAGVLVELPGAAPYPPGYPAQVVPPITGTPADLAEQFREYTRAGIADLQVWVNPPTAAGVEYVATALALLERA